MIKVLMIIGVFAGNLLGADERPIPEFIDHKKLTGIEKFVLQLRATGDAKEVLDIERVKNLIKNTLTESGVPISDQSVETISFVVDGKWLKRGDGSKGLFIWSLELTVTEEVSTVKRKKNISLIVPVWQYTFNGIHYSIPGEEGVDIKKELKEAVKEFVFQFQESKKK